MNAGLTDRSERRVLFVCVENAARSQIADGFFKKYAPNGWRSLSAGTRPGRGINPLAIEVMQEAGIDIGGQHPREISKEFIDSAKIIINMGCMGKSDCPAVFLSNCVNWNIDDPKGKQVAEFRRIRDAIEAKVVELCKSLT